MSAAPAPKPEARTPNSKLLSPHIVGAVIVLCGIAASYLPRTEGHGIIRIAADLLGGRLNALFLILGGLALLIPAFQADRKRGLWRTFTWEAVRGEYRKSAFWTEFTRAAALMLAETVFVHCIKVITGLWMGILKRPSGGWQGFPSGHAAASVVMAYLLTCRYPHLAVVWYAMAALISWSRVESGAHFGYQVVGGAVVGLFTILLLAPRFPSAAQTEAIPEKEGAKAAG